MFYNRELKKVYQLTVSDSVSELATYSASTLTSALELDFPNASVELVGGSLEDGNGAHWKALF